MRDKKKSLYLKEKKNKINRRNEKLNTKIKEYKNSKDELYI